MLQQFEQIDKMLEKITARMNLLQKERNDAAEELASVKNQIQEKDLEIIRTKKDMQRSIEQLEREKMNLQKDMQQLEQRLGDMVSKIKGIIPDEQSPMGMGNRPSF